MSTDDKTEEQAEREPLPGESEYALARAMPHNAIPTYGEDAAYLELLGKSAELGFSRALSKLGDYAIRRKAWVEAYYWKWMARRNGMAGCNTPLREIRMAWAASGYPTEDYNVSEQFTEEHASVGRALLDLTAGRNRLEARAFLREHFPDLVK